MKQIDFVTFAYIFCSLNGIVLGQQQNVTAPDIGVLIGSTTKSAWSNQIIYQFLGVRYAKSPSGQNRFKEPVSAIPWPGVHNVQNYSRSCPTYKEIEENNIGDIEDCLHMSIYSKNLSSNNPVMVFIHGGSFSQGSSKIHPPDYLLESEIILVVPQYRLGPLGFLSTQSESIVGNAGLFDVVLALNWIKRYIKYFGGDESRITVFGQSSGAAMVSALLISNQVPDNIFHRAIIQSGSYFGPTSFDINPIENAKGIAICGGCKQAETIEEITVCLREMNIKTLFEAYKKYVEIFPNGRMKLSINDFLPLTPNDVKKENFRPKNIPILVGATKHDVSFFLAKIYDELVSTVGLMNITYNRNYLIDKIMDSTGIIDSTGTLKAVLSELLFTQLELLNGNFTELIPGLLDMVNDILIKGPILTTVQIFARTYPNQTFLYTFDYKGKYAYFNYFNNNKYPFHDGVHHCDELLYLFPYPEYASNLNDADTGMAKKMVELWTSFARNELEKIKDVKWLPVTNLSGPYLHINNPLSIGTNFLKELSVVTNDSKHHYNSTNLMKDVNVFLVL